MRLRSLLILAAAGLAVAPALATPAVAEPAPDGRFIVTVADAYDSRTVAEEHRRNGAEVDFVYTAALNGFAGAMSQAELGDLQRDRRVTRIERDGVVTASETTQSNATWGLDRIDARSGLNGTYTYTPTGSGVAAYIIDTGIKLSHHEFTGRMGTGHDAVTAGGNADDCNGHGTHVAGTVGGTVYGVAKAVIFHPVRVLDCSGSGTWSGVIAGLDWVTAHHAAGTPAVANMSLGGGANTSVDDAVQRTIDDGVTVVVAAGNGNAGGREQDACGYSPARVPAALTIGATTKEDAKTSWSNYGDCVDLFAPGSGITSAWHSGDTATNTISGTSMAAPHVAGVAALYLQGNATATPATVAGAIVETSTKGVVTSSKTAANHLVFSRLTSETVTTGTIAGTVTSSADGKAIAGAVVSAGGLSTTSGTEGTYSLALAEGTYDVTASATGYDTSTVKGVAVKAGQTTTTNIALTTSGGGSGTPISLTATPYKLKGVHTVDLAWSGATSTDVDVHRDAVKVTTKNDGAYTDNIGNKGGATYVYKVCEAGTTTCSNDVTVTF